MNIVKKLFSISIVLIYILPLFSQNNDDVTLLPLKAGVAKVNITPKEMLQLSGYANRKGPATGVRDSLHVVVIVFDDGVKKAAIITLDLEGASKKDGEMICNAVGNSTGLSSDEIIINVSHTHGSPLMGVSESYRNDVINKLTEATKTAINSLQPVSIGYGEGEIDFNVNRRIIDDNGKCIPGFNPDGICDHRVKVLRIDNSNSISPMAVIFSIACHANVLRGENTMVSSDYPGLAKTFIEENYKNTTALFLQGCTGDVRSYMPYLDGRTEGYGRSGSEADLTWCGWSAGSEVIKVSTKLRVNEQLVQRPEDYAIATVADNITISANTKETKRNRDRLTDGKIILPVKMIRIGSICFVGLPGEPVMEYGLNIEEKLKQMGMKEVFVLGYMDGDIGYIPTKHMFSEGGYETEGAFLPSCEEEIMAGVTKLAEVIIPQK